MSLEIHNTDVTELQREVVQLRHRHAKLIALLRLIMTMLKVARFSLTCVRGPEERDKNLMLRAIDQARIHFPLRMVLRIIGLTHGRYYAWSGLECGHQVLLSCPRPTPQQLTPAEISTIREMVTSDEYQHVSTGTLTRLTNQHIALG